MSGKIFDEIKKKSDTKKREKLKFFTALIVTNLFVFMLSYSSGKIQPTPSGPRKELKVLHHNYKMVVLPLTLLLEIDPNAKEIPISLFSKSKKLLVSRAYLHEETKKEEKIGGFSRFKIEIPEAELLKISADTENDLIALPAIELKTATVATKQRVSNYEINF